MKNRLYPDKFNNISSQAFQDMVLENASQDFFRCAQAYQEIGYEKDEKIVAKAMDIIKKHEQLGNFTFEGWQDLCEDLDFLEERYSRCFHGITPDERILDFNGNHYKEYRENFSEIEKSMLSARLVPYYKFSSHDLQGVGRPLFGLKIMIMEARKEGYIDYTLRDQYIHGRISLPAIKYMMLSGLGVSMGGAINREEIDIGELNQNIEIQLQARSKRSLKRRKKDGGLQNTVEIINNIPQGTTLSTDAGVLGLVQWNIIKNACCIVRDTCSGELTEKDRKLQNHLGDKPFTVTIDHTGLKDADIIHIYDNGLGFDLTGLKDALVKLVDTYGIETLEDTGRVDSTLVEALKKRDLSPYAFFPAMGPELGNMTKVYGLSGGANPDQHSGSGLWAAKRLIDDLGGTILVGQGKDGIGACFSLILPKKESTDTVIKDLSKKIMEGCFLPESMQRVA